MIFLINSNIQFISLIFKTMSRMFRIFYIYAVKILRLLSIVRSWANILVLWPFLMCTRKIRTNVGIVFEVLNRSFFCFKIYEFISLNLLSNLPFLFNYYRIWHLELFVITCLEEYEKCQLLYKLADIPNLKLSSHS
jgi:hypothetical protein